MIHQTQCETHHNVISAACLKVSNVSRLHWHESFLVARSLPVVDRAIEYYCGIDGHTRGPEGIVTFNVYLFFPLMLLESMYCIAGLCEKVVAHERWLGERDKK